ncbi:hypothetical protein CAPTEDRAFT_219396 [Capitella teleta]|uniref:Uncharacterized protein n=1 Tax=Capitella teleta TaxID=283909 RepID=R7UZJ4_CAPTE|nr:hypothetical protein CAPTEDRAFT_219396 [Capitella teleta]|eukprot:ELU12008.1 hypothetical protein CAPTEDRAFT_219396 [Capitella teleta]
MSKKHCQFETMRHWDHYFDYPMNFEDVGDHGLSDPVHLKNGDMIQEWSLTSILQLSQPEEEAVEQVLTAVEPSSLAHSQKLSFVQMMKQVGDHSKNSVKRKTPNNFLTKTSSTRVPH